jgi:hypothetical protein
VESGKLQKAATQRVVKFKVPDLFLKIVGFLVVNRYRQGILLTVYVLKA